MHSKKKLPKNYMDLIFVPEPNLTWNKNKQKVIFGGRCRIFAGKNPAAMSGVSF